VSEQKIVVNLSPSEQKKNGPFFDLAMGIGILKERGELKGNIPEESVFIGALALDGTVDKVEGMLPALIAAKSLGFKRVYLPYDPLIPLEMLKGLECVVVQHIHGSYSIYQEIRSFHFITPRKSSTLFLKRSNIPKTFWTSLATNKRSMHLKLQLQVSIIF
jgi:predicted ATPase with chaperone activity